MYLERIKQLVTDMRAVQIHTENKNKIKNDEFKMLLAAPQALIKGADFYSIPVLSRQTTQIAPREKVRENLEKNYNITNYDSAVGFLRSIETRGIGWMYQQFVNDWKGNPTVNIEALETNKRKHYDLTKEFAVRFQKIVGKFGLYAWDIAMGIDVAREIHTAGYFSEKVTLEFAEDFATKAAEVYPNWEHYGIGVICGGAMYDYSRTLNEKDADASFDFMYSIVERLFTDKSVMVWNTNRFMEIRRYFRHLTSNIEFFDPKLYCIVSTEIAAKERPIGYFFREPTEETNVSDSGWRFFAGDETNRDANNPDKFQAVTLNVICNYDAEVMPFLKSDIGSAFERDENGKFVVSVES
ncbi:hypothetical protein FACS1894132_10030 [Clostridia bacterium]|nr:hypothetical protein FACS1894132_10030 [Clostridia bacterium]